MTNKSLRDLLLSELENGPGTCSELTERLRSRGRAVIETNVFRALRRMADDDLLIESVTPIVRHLTRREIEESGTITYELADGPDEEHGLGYMQGRGAA